METKQAPPPDFTPIVTEVVDWGILAEVEGALGEIQLTRTKNYLDDAQATVARRRKLLLLVDQTDDVPLTFIRLDEWKKKGLITEKDYQGMQERLGVTLTDPKYSERKKLRSVREEEAKRRGEEDRRQQLETLRAEEEFARKQKEIEEKERKDKEWKARYERDLAEQVGRGVIKVIRRDDGAAAPVELDYGYMKCQLTGEGKSHVFADVIPGLHVLSTNSKGGPDYLQINLLKNNIVNVYLDWRDNKWILYEENEGLSLHGVVPLLAKGMLLLKRKDNGQVAPIRLDGREYCFLSGKNKQFIRNDLQPGFHLLSVQSKGGVDELQVRVDADRITVVSLDWADNKWFFALGDTGGGCCSIM
jgi:hypothetical protein